MPQYSLPFKPEDKVLEVGGGDRPIFHPNLDCRPMPTVDIVADLNEPWPAESEAYDGVFGMYIMEHLSWRKVRRFISETHRVLKPGGKVVMITANLLEQARKLVEAKEWNDDLVCMVFGDQNYQGEDWISNAHFCGFSPSYAIKLFSEAGFSNVTISEHPNCKTDMVIEAAKSPQAKVSQIIFEDPKYWCGELGYRPDAVGVGYSDFSINRVKVEHIMSQGPERVLDVGCAMGYVVARLRKAGVDAWGIDISKYALDHAPGDVKPYLAHGSAEVLPWADKSFDMVVTFGTLEHLPMETLLKAMAEIKRVARRGIIAIDPAENPYFDKDPTHITKQPLSWWRRQFPPEFEVRSDDNRGWLKEKPVKVALLSTPVMRVPPPRYGGLERIVYDLGWALAGEGHQVTVFAPDGSQVEGCEMVYLGPALERVHADWLKAETEAMNKVADRLMNGGFEIINGHNWFGMEYYLKAQKPELKVCHTHHGGMNMEWWGASKPPWPLNLIAISAWMKKVHQSQGFSSGIVYNGISIEDYPFKAGKGSRLLFVGRLDSFKRPHIAIEVAKRTGLGLDIVGGSFVIDVAYMEQIKQACDGRQIKLYLDAPHKQKVELYQKARAVIFPSKMGEPFGLIVPEANACGTPVIATPDGAIPETLEDGVTGFICDTIDKMVEAVGKVDQIRPEDCRARVEMLFTREMMAVSYTDAYKRVIAGEEW